MHIGHKETLLSFKRKDSIKRHKRIPVSKTLHSIQGTEEWQFKNPRISKTDNETEMHAFLYVCVWGVNFITYKVLCG